jgi:hypothetical protein
MHKFSYVVGCLLGASALVVSLPGYADIPPPDYCSVEGATCNNASGNEKAGTCSAAQCSRRLPDGSFMSYDCFRCVAPAVGEGGASSGGVGGGGAPAHTGGTVSTTGGAAATTGGHSSATGGQTSATGGAAGAGGDTTKDDGGCSLSPLAAQRGLAGLMTALGLSALFFARRRR